MQEDGVREFEWGTSPTVGKLATAVAKAQSEMGAATKSGENPHFRSKYADVSAVNAAVMPVLNGKGIAVFQFPSTQIRELGGKPHMLVSVWTRLQLGEEYIACRVSSLASKADPQGVGSAITYLRRYGLSAIVNLSTEDDDGNAASGKEKTNGQAKATAPKKQDEDAVNDMLTATGV